MTVKDNLAHKKCRDDGVMNRNSFRINGNAQRLPNIHTNDTHTQQPEAYNISNISIYLLIFLVLVTNPVLPVLLPVVAVMSSGS
jgi:hypothetical protein